MLIDSPVCRLLGIKYPIFQGGMASLGTWQLVSAVSEAGGLGIIGSGGQTPGWLREQVDLTRSKTANPFGVNIMLMSPHLEENLKVLVEKKVSIVTFGGGNPGLHIKMLKDAGIRLIPVVSSVALARRLERSGVDAVIAEGRESGGHVGDTATMVLVPQVVDAIKLPVIAAGGIADSRGLVAAFALGASGIQVGTRFICSDECIAHPRFKEYIINAQDRATVVTGANTGHPVRCLENKLTRTFAEMEKRGASPAELDELGRGKLVLGVIEGNIEQGSLMAGEISGLIKDIKPVKEIIEDMINGADRVLQSMNCPPGRI
jgi:enoyl-[acyl-carrier protein] reductase II